MKILKRLHNESGIALLTVVILTLFLFSLSLTYFEKIGGEKRMALASQNGLTANLIADAALEEIFWRYNYNSFSTTAAANGWTVGGSSATYGSSGSPISFTDTSGNAVGTYYASITNYATAPVVTVDANYTGGSGAQLGNASQVKAELQQGSPFSYAVAAKSALDFSNSSYIDSYDSSAGNWNSTTNKGTSGNVLTTTTAANAITMSNSSHIDGDVSYGGSVGASRVINNNSSYVTGSESGSATFTFTTPTAPSLSYGYSGGSMSSYYNTGTYAYSMSNSNTDTFAAGSYRFTTFALANSAVLTLSGDTTIYVESTSTAWDMSNSSQVIIPAGATLKIYTRGSFNIQNSASISNGGTPNNFQIYGTAATSDINISNSANLEALIDTPLGDVSIANSGGLSGAVICNDLNISNSSFIHYDTQATNASIDGSGYSLKWYRRIK